ncbi:malonate decarboxylase subunit alpha [Paracoccus kondratievae]
MLTKVGMETFADPALEGCAMNATARATPIVKRVAFEGEDWLYFPALRPDVALIRATTADENGNLTFEDEGATLGAMEMALAAHNCGGIVIAQVRRIAAQGTLKPHDVKVPGILVDVIVEAPDQLQTTATPHDPAISGEVFRPLASFRAADFNPGKVIARRVAQELRSGWAVNIGFGISANVPRILIEEGLHGAVTWVIEQGAVGACRCWISSSAAPVMQRRSSLRRISSAISRRAVLTVPCCPSWKSTPRARSMSAGLPRRRIGQRGRAVSSTLPRGRSGSFFPGTSTPEQRCELKMAGW